MGEIKRDSWLDLAWVLQSADPCSRIHSKLVITCTGRHREGRGLGALSLRRQTASRAPDWLEQALSETLNCYF